MEKGVLKETLTYEFFHKAENLREASKDAFTQFMRTKYQIISPYLSQGMQQDF